MADKLAMGLETTGLGLLVTFVALFSLILIITLFSYIMRDKKKAKKAKRAVKTRTEAQNGQVADTGEMTAVIAAAVAAQDDELAAVFAAAVAAYTTAEEPEGKLVVRSYRKIPSAWAKAGRDAQIYNKF